MRRVILMVVGVLLMARLASATPPCAGDCSAEGMVTVDELTLTVAVALGTAPRTDCEPADRDGNFMVTIDEVVSAVQNARSGCPDFVGEYFGTVDLNEGQTATMNLTVRGDATASGLVNIFPAGLTALRPRGALAPIQSLTIIGSVDLDTGTYNLSGSFVDANQQTVPVMASGTLPVRATGAGAFTFQLGDDTFPNGSIVKGDGSAPTPTQTPAATATPSASPTLPGPTATSPPLPTAAPGCGGAYALLELSERSPDANLEESFTSYEFTKGSGSLLLFPTQAIFSANAGKCPVEVLGVSRAMQVGVYSTQADFVPGLTFELNVSSAPGLPPNLFGYSEATAAPSLKTWKAMSGTAMVVAVDGNRVTMRITNAHVVPVAPPAMGTFTVNGTVVVDATVTHL